MDNGSFMVTEYGVRRVRTKNDVVPVITLDLAIAKKKKLEDNYKHVFGQSADGVFEIVEREASPYWKAVKDCKHENITGLMGL